MKKLDLKLRITSEPGIFHDSRKDVRLLGGAINKIVDKVNELIEENNRLNKLIAVQGSVATAADSSTTVDNHK